MLKKKNILFPFVLSEVSTELGESANAVEGSVLIKIFFIFRQPFPAFAQGYGGQASSSRMSEDIL